MVAAGAGFDEVAVVNAAVVLKPDESFERHGWLIEWMMIPWDN